MLKTFETILLVSMILLLFTLCGCRDSAVPEEEQTPEPTAASGFVSILTNFDTEQSKRMANFMGVNRAHIEDNMLYCFEYDKDYAPVLACYEIADGGLTHFKVLAEDCVPQYLSFWEGRLYYINGNGSSAVESIGADGSDRRVLLDEPCTCLQLWDGCLYFCDASGNFCRAGLDGGDKTLLIDDICCYAYYMDGAVLYQSGSDGESLHWVELESGTDRKLTGTVSYVPVILENTLYYTQKTAEGNRICSLELDTGYTQVYETPLIKGAAEFIYDEARGWCVRAIPADERVEQSIISVQELGTGAWTQCGYSGYRLCDWAGDGRIDAAYENGGRLRNFVLVWPQGETEYIAGQIRQK